MTPALDDVLDRLVRDVEDWPEPGVLFRDVTPLLADPPALRVTVERLTELSSELADGPVDKVVGIEARGFILAVPVALALGAGFVPARKAGKLPATTHQVSYDLEYGSATLEMHTDALVPGERVVVLDDVLATGGTMAAVDELVAATGAEVVGNVTMLEIGPLGGRSRLPVGRFGTLRTY
ncbi:adenine phosphoribosyltransferase [Mumia flava]|uniref:Adenine phosphoribosyltransferase n=1 Tax=Mumia flava TaxID=1348852 RepID=A0A0B2BCT5_9ACTN|nr:adenine phosphoribosyltransferase [Mumia flava]PJJ55877.1 adenine phosphoribosyltransferase [Mumia flava]